MLIEPQTTSAGTRSSVRGPWCGDSKLWNWRKPSSDASSRNGFGKYLRQNATRRCSGGVAPCSSSTSPFAEAFLTLASGMNEDTALVARLIV